MQAPLAISTAPNNKVLCLCLPGTEFQVGLANLVGSVTSNFKIDRLEFDTDQPECVRCVAPKFLDGLSPRDNRRIGRQKLGILGIESSHTGIVLARGSCTKPAIFLGYSLSN